ncbi:N-acetylmuramoyl-L-alanine amidase-like domain-containing protein [uncultured Parabacteroides sp.]|uniref:N-acetylmuramoyl-L-alanine amidase-like domain-containing protein n=1 Tax=uncultured Parabacteroides sp. TaxID=512312 RepID=UPI00262F3DE7|nr:N-acetylmuramoyl-L-alanine amidase-like domain-containing protein [uncultured Parabacteroides sp.]
MRGGMGILGFCMWAWLAFGASAQDCDSFKLYCTVEDRSVFDRYYACTDSKKSLPLNELMIHTALFFRETPYVASTLEREPEGLVVNLRELDCTTFAETVLALSRTMQGENTSFESFCENLRYLRYREGTIRDYTDRLHYMTDWFYENERKGIVRDIGQEIGGILLPLELSFISTHPNSYKQLKSHPELIRKIANKEKEINRRSYYYVPKGKIDKCSSGIKNGDILCFVTSIKGLDVTHVGIAYWKEGRLTFIHASSSARKVIIQESSLRDYAEGIKSCKGILIARPLPTH